MADPAIQQAFALAVGHHQAGRLAEAERIYRQILAHNPGHADAMHNLGALAYGVGRNTDAIELFKRAIALRGDFSEAYYNLGNALKGNGQVDEAIAAYRQAIAINPKSFEAHLNLGYLLKDAGWVDEAIEALQKAVALKPDYAEAYGNLGNVLRTKGRLEEAVAAYRRVIALKPEYGEAHNNLGIALRDQGLLDEAIAALRQSIALKPDYADAYSNLGNVLKDKNQLDNAMAAYRRAIALAPNNPHSHSNLGNVLREVGQIDEAIAAYRQAMAVAPDNPEAYSSLIFTLHYHSGLDAQVIAEEHRLWNVRHGEPLRKYMQPPSTSSGQAHGNDRDPERRLRIGYVSGDFQEHPVGRFLLPLLEHHDHGEFEVFCYSNSLKADAMTASLRSCSDHWREIAGMNDEQVAGLVRADAIDILIDLSGHTGGNRLLVFARKPAPVQVSYLGYPGATGLSAIDYRLSDCVADGFESEGVYRLPRSNWCFAAPRDAPEVAAPPVLRRGWVTFGSFNNVAKVTEATLKVWGEILCRVPDSRLFLKASAYGSAGARQRVLGIFKAEGIDGGRVDFQGSQRDHASHLTRYGDVDVALDTFPYNGTTTTCDALWMGVPVVTLAGQTHVSRVGMSLLSNIGLSETIATTTDEYIGLAVALAQDRDRMETLRRGMREQMRMSPLMDAEGFARDVEAAYRQMWRNWCAEGGKSSVQSTMTVQEQFESGLSHHQAGRLLEAEALYRQVLAQQSDHAEALHLLGVLAAQAGRNDIAVDLMRRAITHRPKYAQAHSDLGNVLISKGQLDEAIAVCRQAIALRPSYAMAHNNLGNALGGKGQLDEAVAAYREAIVLNPNFAEAHSNLGNTLKDKGQVDAAIAAYRQAIGVDPDNASIDSNLLYTLHLHPGFNAETIAKEHRRWNRQHAEPLRNLLVPHTNNRDPDRRLRVGYVSPDFREHPVGRFLLPLLEHHHHRQFEVFCYSNSRKIDAITTSLRADADRWREIVGLNDEQIAGQVRADAIDILIDLCGHTAGNRMLVFARKPAPVQVSYLGYPGTTGMNTIDYRLTDGFADPEDRADDFHSERLYRLPRTNWCFAAPQDAPAVQPPPVFRRGYVTFGSFNNFAKVTEPMLQVWAEILRQVPGSRLLLKAGAFGAASVREHVRGIFNAQGIEADRLDLQGWQRDRLSHLALYGEMDIALDTFPYNGTTTTCDAFWMGVPVITLAGQTHVSRVGLSLLSNVGLSETIATTTDEYIGLAIALAQDRDRLKTLRLGLRQRMRISPLMDAPGFARSVEAAYRQMWRNWCETGSAK